MAQFSQHDYVTALREEDSEKLAECIKQNPEFLDTQPCNTMSPAQVAAHANNMKVFELIKEHRPKLLDETGCCFRRHDYPSAIVGSKGYVKTFEFIVSNTEALKDLEAYINRAFIFENNLRVYDAPRVFVEKLLDLGISADFLFYHFMNHVKTTAFFHSTELMCNITTLLIGGADINKYFVTLTPSLPRSVLDNIIWAYNLAVDRMEQERASTSNQ